MSSRPVLKERPQSSQLGEGAPLERLGDYLLLDRISESYMSEIYLAIRDSNFHQDRLVALKKMHPHVSGNQDGEKDFLKEIRIAASLMHPNIVRVLDFGKSGETPFIAMEWVQGPTLKKFLNKYLDRGMAVPLELVLWIGSQIAGALDYMHSYVDPLTGKTLPIFHRDVSPQNFILALDGNLKVIDFGISKIVSESTMTSTGPLRGKLSYLSPEHFSGAVVDHQSDLFALGVVLYELLTGKKLFQGENDFDTIEKIRNCDNALKQVHEDCLRFDRELAVIICRCLRRNKAQRFPSANALKEDLLQCAHRFGVPVTSHLIARTLADLFGSEFQERRDRALQLLERAHAQPQGPAVASGAGPINRADASPQENSPVQLVVVPNPSVAFRSPAPRAGFWGPGRIAFAVLVAVAAAYGSRGFSPFAQKLPPGLKIAINPESGVQTHVYLQGKETGIQDGILRVPSEGRLNIQFLRDGYKPYSIQLSPENLTDFLGSERVLQIDLLPVHQGWLSVTASHSVPVRFTNGKETWIKSAPFESFALPPGDYKVSASSGEASLDFAIVEGQVTSIDDLDNRLRIR